MGAHPHAAMKGVQSPCPLLVPVFREAYDRTKPTEEGRASALRGPGCRAWTQRSSTRARPKSRLRLAPPGARRGEPAAALLPVERERARDEEEVAPAEVSVRLRLGALLLQWVTIGSPPSCQSRRGYRSLAPGYMLPLAGRGYDKQGGYIKSHKDGTLKRARGTERVFYTGLTVSPSPYIHYTFFSRRTRH